MVKMNDQCIVWIDPSNGRTEDELRRRLKYIHNSGEYLTRCSDFETDACVEDGLRLFLHAASYPGPELFCGEAAPVPRQSQLDIGSLPLPRVRYVIGRYIALRWPHSRASYI